MRTHHGIYDAVLEKDEERDHDRQKDLMKAKLTLTECILALVIALTCVSLHAVFLGKFHLVSNYLQWAYLLTIHEIQLNRLSTSW